jgi:hypothetical protein
MSCSGGGPGHRGTLQGFRSGQTVDFRQQIGIYVLYDESHKAIYVGQAGGRARLFSRLRHHHRVGQLVDRWGYFSWFGLLSVTKRGKLKAARLDSNVRGTFRGMLNELEGVLIAATEPPFNKQGAKFKGIARYRQEPLEETTPTILDVSKKVDEIIEQMKKHWEA